MAVARLGTGTPSSANYLRGDGAWTAAPADVVTSVFTRTGAVVAVSGDYAAFYAAAVHIHAAADITSGVMAVARLGTGTPDNTKYLRGDGSWQVVAAGGSQTPWTSDIDAAQHNLNNAASVYIHNASQAVSFQPAGLQFSAYPAGSLRWYFYVGGTESGSNSGSDFNLLSYSDASTNLGSPLNIARGTGTITMDIGTAGYYYLRANGTTRVAVDSSGQVCIGLPYPSYKLDIAGDCNLSSGSVYRINGTPISTSQTPWTSDINAGQHALFNANAVYIYDGVSHQVAFQPTGFAFMNSGNNRWNFYIGGTESGANSGSDFALSRYSDTNANIGSPFLISRATGAIALDAGTGNLTIQAANVVVGAATPYPKFGVYGGSIGAYTSTGATSGSPIAGSLYLGDSNFWSAGFFDAAPSISAVWDGYTNNAAALAFYTYPAALPKLERMRISALGNVGIGTNAPTHQLQLSSDDAVKLTTTTWTTTSDSRIKRNIKDLVGGLDIIKRLRPIEAEYNGLCGTPEGQRVVSFLAEEIREVLPGTVKSTRGKLRKDDAEETDILNLNIHEVLMHLVLAVKQLALKVNVTSE